MATTLMVCSGGGHLKQLFELSERMGIPVDEQLWVTFANAQSTSLLSGRRVAYVPFTAPRDYPNIVRLRVRAHAILREHRDITRAVSTGSSPAVAFLPLTARRGIPSFYIESAARATGPSLSGRLMRLTPKIATFTQYPGWADDHWVYGGSIYDAFAPGTLVPDDVPLRRAVVSVGTQEGYPFDRLFESLVPLLKNVDDVLWQTGDQDVSRFGIQGVGSVPHDEMNAAVSNADVVIMHAGTGSALTCMNAGKHAILVPRLKKYGEHVDDHQLQIARELALRGLATMRAASDITWDDLRLAARSSVTHTTPPPFVLEAHPRATSSR